MTSASLAAAAALASLRPRLPRITGPGEGTHALLVTGAPLPLLTAHTHGHGNGVSGSGNSSSSSSVAPVVTVGEVNSHGHGVSSNPANKTRSRSRSNSRSRSRSQSRFSNAAGKLNTQSNSVDDSASTSASAVSDGANMSVAALPVPVDAVTAANVYKANRRRSYGASNADVQAATGEGSNNGSGTGVAADSSNLPKSHAANGTAAANAGAGLVGGLPRLTTVVDAAAFASALTAAEVVSLLFPHAIPSNASVGSGGAAGSVSQPSASAAALAGAVQSFPCELALAATVPGTLYLTATHLCFQGFLFGHQLAFCVPRAAVARLCVTRPPSASNNSNSNAMAGASSANLPGSEAPGGVNGLRVLYGDRNTQPTLALSLPLRLLPSAVAASSGGGGKSAGAVSPSSAYTSIAAAAAAVGGGGGANGATGAGAAGGADGNGDTLELVRGLMLTGMPLGRALELATLLAATAADAAADGGPAAPNGTGTDGSAGGAAGSASASSSGSSSPLAGVVGNGATEGVRTPVASASAAVAGAYANSPLSPNPNAPLVSAATLLANANSTANSTANTTSASSSSAAATPVAAAAAPAAAAAAAVPSDGVPLINLLAPAPWPPRVSAPAARMPPVPSLPGIAPAPDVELTFVTEAAFPVSVAQFWSFFFADAASYNFVKLHAEFKKDHTIELSRWVESAIDAGAPGQPPAPSVAPRALNAPVAAVRALSNVGALACAERAVSANVYLGSPIGPERCMMYKYQRASLFEHAPTPAKSVANTLPGTHSTEAGVPVLRLHLDMSSLTPDAPFGECFHILEHMELADTVDPATGAITGCVGKVMLCANVLKKPLRFRPFVSTLLGRARTDGGKDWANVFAHWNSVLRAARDAATGEIKVGGARAPLLLPLLRPDAPSQIAYGSLLAAEAAATAAAAAAAAPFPAVSTGAPPAPAVFAGAPGAAETDSGAASPLSPLSPLAAAAAAGASSSSTGAGAAGPEWTRSHMLSALAGAGASLALAAVLESVLTRARSTLAAGGAAATAVGGGSGGAAGGMGWVGAVVLAVLAVAFAKLCDVDVKVKSLEGVIKQQQQQMYAITALLQQQGQMQQVQTPGQGQVQQGALLMPPGSAVKARRR